MDAAVTPPLSATVLAAEYLTLAETFPPSDFMKTVKPHVFRMLFAILKGLPEDAHCVVERGDGVGGCDASHNNSSTNGPASKKDNLECNASAGVVQQTQQQTANNKGMPKQGGCERKNNAGGLTQLPSPPKVEVRSDVGKRETRATLTQQLQKAKTLDECRWVVKAAESAVQGGELNSPAAVSPLSWYHRHRQREIGATAVALKQKKEKSKEKASWIESGTRMY